MSFPSQAADSSRTPATGTKRRYLGAARRKRTTDISLLSPAGAKQQCSNPMDHADKDDLLNEKLNQSGHAKPESRVTDKITDPSKRTCDSCSALRPKIQTPSGKDIIPPPVTPNSRVPSGMHFQSENNFDEAGASSSLSLSPSSQRLQTTPIHRFPSRHSFSSSARKRFRHDDFKSPVRNQQDSPKPTDTVESVSKEVSMLQQTVKELESEIASLTNEGHCEDELQNHIEKMHEYNELKDIGQMLLGKIALVEGVTTKDLYARFGLDLDD